MIMSDDFLFFSALVEKLKLDYSQEKKIMKGKNKEISIA